MQRTPLQHVECFHLILLRLLEARVDRSIWIVKGGVNLRAFFASRRYSEDLDIDAVRGQPHVLADKVDKLLVSRPFNEMLASQGLRVVSISKPKQTGTTQRWKFEVRCDPGVLVLHTRVEFSRRASDEGEHCLEPVLKEIVRPYGLPAPTVRHYSSRAAIHQKILALASRAEPQARDVWDLDHLLRTRGVDAAPLPPALLRHLPLALERLLAMPFDAYKAQVVPFLSADDQAIFGTRSAWERMRELVLDRLSELDQ